MVLKKMIIFVLTSIIHHDQRHQLYYSCARREEEIKIVGKIASCISTPLSKWVTNAYLPPMGLIFFYIVVRG